MQEQEKQKEIIKKAKDIINNISMLVKRDFDRHQNVSKQLALIFYDMSSPEKTKLDVDDAIVGLVILLSPLSIDLKLFHGLYKLCRREDGVVYPDSINIFSNLEITSATTIEKFLQQKRDSTTISIEPTSPAQALSSNPRFLELKAQVNSAMQGFLQQINFHGKGVGDCEYNFVLKIDKTSGRVCLKEALWTPPVNLMVIKTGKAIPYQKGITYSPPKTNLISDSDLISLRGVSTAVPYVAYGREILLQLPFECEIPISTDSKNQKLLTSISKMVHVICDDLSDANNRFTPIAFPIYQLREGGVINNQGITPLCMHIEYCRPEFLEIKNVEMFNYVCIPILSRKKNILRGLYRQRFYFLIIEVTKYLNNESDLDIASVHEEIRKDLFINLKLKVDRSLLEELDEHKIIYRNLFDKLMSDEEVYKNFFFNDKQLPKNILAFIYENGSTAYDIPLLKFMDLFIGEERYGYQMLRAIFAATKQFLENFKCWLSLKDIRAMIVTDIKILVKEVIKYFYEDKNAQQFLSGSVKLVIKIPFLLNVSTSQEEKSPQYLDVSKYISYEISKKEHGITCSIYADVSKILQEHFPTKNNTDILDGLNKIELEQIAQISTIDNLCLFFEQDIATNRPNPKQTLSFDAKKNLYNESQGKEALNADEKRIIMESLKNSKTIQAIMQLMFNGFYFINFFDTKTALIKYSISQMYKVLIPKKFLINGINYEFVLERIWHTDVSGSIYGKICCNLQLKEQLPGKDLSEKSFKFFYDLDKLFGTQDFKEKFSNEVSFDIHVTRVLTSPILNAIKKLGDNSEFSNPSSSINFFNPASSTSMPLLSLKDCSYVESKVSLVIRVPYQKDGTLNWAPIEMNLFQYFITDPYFTLEHDAVMQQISRVLGEQVSQYKNRGGSYLEAYCEEIIRMIGKSFDEIHARIQPINRYLKLFTEYSNGSPSAASAAAAPPSR